MWSGGEDLSELTPTKGISCQKFVDGSSCCFTILDLGGQGEFLATHQVFIGDGTVPVIDCLVLSTLDDALEENAFKWCSLFAGRNQPTPTPWPLMMIVTRADKANNLQMGAVEVAFNNIKRTFGGHFRFPFSKLFFIDAREPADGLMTEFRQSLSALHAELLAQDQPLCQPAICRSITENLQALRKSIAAPIISKDEFTKFMLPRIKITENDRAFSDAALAGIIDSAVQYLTGSATLLTFSHPSTQDLVVIDPPWLLSDIVGRLMAEPPLPGPYVTYANGFADKDDFIAKLETKHTPGQVALEMCSGLGFCLQWTEKVLNPVEAHSSTTRQTLALRSKDDSPRRSATEV